MGEICDAFAWGSIIKQSHNGQTTFYNSCFLNPLNLRINDFVVIANDDDDEPNFVGKILKMYENKDIKLGQQNRAKIEMYTSPNIVIKLLQKDKYEKYDFLKNEIIQDLRPFDNDIDIETISRHCIVKFSIEKIDEDIDNTHIENMYICRYKLIRNVFNKYELVPISIISESESIKNEYKRIYKSHHKNIQTNVNFKENNIPISINYNLLDKSQVNNTEKLVTPLKISNNTIQKVKRLNLNDIETILDTDNENIDNNNDENNDKLEKNCMENKLSHRKSLAVKRNLNFGEIDNNGNNLDKHVKSKELRKIENNLNIKIKISDNREMNCKYTICSDVTDSPRQVVKRKGSVSAILENTSPTKNRKNIVNKNIYVTPKTQISQTSQRRKSILKTPSLHESATTKNVITDNVRRSVNFKRQHEVHSYKPCDEDDNIESIDSNNSYMNIGNKNITVENCPRSLKKSTSVSKLMKSNDFTPILSKRNTSINLKKSDLELVREQLHVSAVPKNLPCRLNEFKNISTFIESKILDKCGGCMYISGVPGTGKTATVTEVIRSLQLKCQLKKLPEFKFIEINGMLMTEPRQAYVHINKQLTGKTVSWAQAHLSLETFFMTKASSNIPIVLLVDELDILCNRRQDVIYNLLDWPSKKSAHLIILTIANTLDLPERLLIGKVTSRLGLTRLTFQPYSLKQLEEVIMARLTGTNSFKSAAVQFVARKVASVSGDCRRALDICRRATEIAEESNKITNNQMVTLENVQEALDQMISSSKIQAIKSCSKLEQLFLQAVCAEISRTGVEETNLLSVYNQFETITNLMGVRTPNPDQTVQISSRLGAQRLLICENSVAGLFQKIILNISADDVHYALKI